jgi:hypothetical protein
VLDPPTYISLLKNISKHYNWEIEVFPTAKLEEMGCGAFTAVTAANKEDIYSQHKTKEGTRDGIVCLRFHRNLHNHTIISDGRFTSYL